MTGERVFIDTNVLVYLYDNDTPTKKARAVELLRDELAPPNIVLSTQVLQEFFVAVTRKLATPLQYSAATAVLEQLSVLSVRVVTTSLIVAAGTRCAHSMLSFWDALIVETALDAGATVLLTEDLQHHQKFGTLLVKNPFLAEPSTPLKSSPNTQSN